MSVDTPLMISTKEKNRREEYAKARKIRDAGRPENERLAAESVFNGRLNTGIRNEMQDQSWDDIVFENRNRDYGAYAVRKRYLNNLATGLAITIIAASFILAYPSIARWFRGDEASIPTTTPRKLVYTELTAPPPIDKPKPPPPQVLLPKLQKVIKFVPPKVVREEVLQASVPTLEEIRENETGAEAVEGPTEVIFDEPVAEVIDGGGDDEIFTVVDQQPEYAGGYEALMAFIQRNMQYPQSARRMQIEGTVHVSFIVSKTGAISDVRVLRGISTDCDKEAIRVVQMMPPWKPGKQNGRPVNVKFILPLKFRLH